MASIHADGSNGHHRITLNLSVQSQSATTNSSTLSYSVVLSSVTTGYGWDYQTNPFLCTFKINGISRTCSLLSYDGSSEVTLASGTQEVIHDNDGRQNVKYQFSVESNDDPNLIGSCSTLGLLSVPSINRVCELSVPTETHNLGSAISMTVQKYVSSFSYTLAYSVGTESGVIAEKATGSSVSWTPPTSLSAQDITKNTLQCVLVLTTYDGTSSSAKAVGTVSQTITLTIPIQAPTIDLTLVDRTTYAPPFYPTPVVNPFYVSKSIVRFWSAPVCHNGATLKKSAVIFLKGSSTGETLAEGVCDTKTDWAMNSDWVGDVYMQVTATDSRGNTATAHKTFTVYQYDFPTITEFKVGRYADSAGTTPADGGGYCKVTYGTSFTSIVVSGAERNSVRVTIEYRVRGTSVWDEALHSSSTASGSVVFAADPSVPYDVRLKVEDETYSRVSSEKILSTGGIFQDWREDGTGIAFGGNSTQSNALESYWPIFEQGTSLTNKYNSKITRITDSSGSVSATSGSNTTCSSTTISTAGYYMVVGYQDWTSSFDSSTTFRIIQKRNDTSISTWTWRHPATGGGGVSGIAFLQINANDVITTEVYQNSGSSKTARTWIYAFRLMS